MSKRFPRYPSDSDYQTNAPSYYDELARKQKLVKELAEKVWEYDKEIAEYFKRWEENLENINEDVIKMMILWFEEGILDEILNMNLMNGKVEIHLTTHEPDTNFENTYWYEIVD